MLCVVCVSKAYFLDMDHLPQVEDKTLADSALSSEPVYLTENVASTPIRDIPCDRTSSSARHTIWTVRVGAPPGDYTLAKSDTTQIKHHCIARIIPVVCGPLWPLSVFK